MIPSFLIAAMLVPGASPAAPIVGPPGPPGPEVSMPVPPPRSFLAPLPRADWVVETADNVCGLTDARQITNPAKVDYDSLLDSTPEIKEMKRKGIDKSSPEGQTLYNKAVDKIRDAASKVMTDKKHCSVWKKIRHKRGKRVPSITDSVRARL